MSHIVEIQAEVRDPAAVAAACRRLALPEPAHGTARLFEGEAAGLLVKLPGWLYPLVCEIGSATTTMGVPGASPRSSTACSRRTPSRRRGSRPGPRGTRPPSTGARQLLGVPVWARDRQ
jgi:hypothetical protein